MSLPSAVTAALERFPQGLGPQRGRDQNPVSLSGQSRCPSCGGSGVLRLSSRRFRTCLDCAGQGVLPVLPARSSFKPQPQLGQALDQLIASTRTGQCQVPAEGLFPDQAN
jgi:hypothetical protein